VNYKGLSATVFHFSLLDLHFLNAMVFPFPPYALRYPLYAKKRGIFLGKNMTKAQKSTPE